MPTTKQIVIEDLKTAIGELNKSEAKKNIWDKEVIAIRNAIRFIRGTTCQSTR